MVINIDPSDNTAAQLDAKNCAPTTSRKRGFAAMDQNHLRDVARRGGVESHRKGTAHEFDSDEARRAGKIGGEAVSRDRAHMAEIGRRGAARRYNPAETNPLDQDLATDNPD